MTPVSISIITAALAAACLGAPALAQDEGGSDVHGYWLTGDADSIVRLYPCEDRPGDLCGRIAWLEERLNEAGEVRTDVENPDSELRGRPLPGLQILWGFEREDPDLFEGGKVYNPEDGRTYSGEIRRTGSGTLHLEGCALRIFCKTQEWQRVPADDPRLEDGASSGQD